MDVQFEERDGVLIARPDGELAGQGAERFRTLFKERAGRSSCALGVIDLNGVPQLDSVGLGALISALRSMIQKGGDLKLCSVRPSARLIFDITRAQNIFDIHTALDDALDALR